MVYYYLRDKLQAIGKENWKAHFMIKTSCTKKDSTKRALSAIVLN